jgi:hypothetical protein
MSDEREVQQMLARYVRAADHLVRTSVGAIDLEKE